MYTYLVYYENSNIVGLTIYLLHNTVCNSKKLLYIIIIQCYLYWILNDDVLLTYKNSYSKIYTQKKRI